MTALQAALQALINAVNTNVTVKVSIDSIDPVDVGDATTDLETFLQSTLNGLQYPNWTSGTGVPTGGTYGAYYRQDAGVGVINIWQNIEGAWTIIYSLNVGGGAIPNSIRSGLQTSISGSIVTVTSGAWYINNNFYSKNTQTQFTLGAADASLTRQDLIYAYTDDDIHIVVGTPGAGVPALPANGLYIDVAVIPSVASGGVPYLLSGGAPGTGIFIPDLGVQANPDTIRQNAWFALASGITGDSSGGIVVARFNNTDYGTQEFTPSDAPFRKHGRTYTLGTWSPWTQITIPVVFGATAYGATVTVVGDILTVTISDFQTSSFKVSVNKYPTLRAWMTTDTQFVEAGVIPNDATYTVVDGSFNLTQIQWVYAAPGTIDPDSLQLEIS